jgi:outer membrane protein OmpA-like peptidoglycan-associated protein
MKRFAVLLAALFSAAAYAQDPPAPDMAPTDVAGGAATAVDSVAVADTVTQPVVDVPAAPAVEEEPKSYRLVLRFEPNSLELTPRSSAALDSMSALFARNTRNRHEVHGYTCPAIAGKGKVARFSAQRVEAIVDYLMETGVPGENIVTIVNAPKTAADGECVEDRQVDIVSAGTRWRDYEPAAAPEPPKPEPPKAVELKPDEFKAEVMEPLKGKLAELEPPKPAEPEPSKAAAAEPDGKQIVAVYMAGQEPQNAKGVHSIMGGELARVMSESEKYTAVDRTEAILEQLDKEHVYQRSGAVDDDEIKAIGRQLGVQYLCISNINPVGKRYYLDTRFVDIVTAEIKRSITATSTLKDAEEMARVGRNIALELLEAEKTRASRLLRKKIFRYTAIGLDILGLGAFAYGYLENNNVVTQINNDNGPEATRAATRRNAAYAVSGALIASGISIHIVF